MDEWTIQKLFSECPKSKTMAIKDIVASAYREGYRQALQDYAVWKDGTQTVGCGIKTLKQATEDFEKDPYYLDMKT